MKLPTAHAMYKRGFTLVELAVVLVIVGLIVGGVMAGRQLLENARLQQQAGQIEKIQTAINTFKLKYSYLPGDIPDPKATGLGFAARTTGEGGGDGNGIIARKCPWCAAFPAYSFYQWGEPLLMWSDLSAAKLIPETIDQIAGGLPFTVGDPEEISRRMPTAKIGGGNFIYEWYYDGSNYLGLSKVTLISSYLPYSEVGLTVTQAYALDTKIDDGFPQAGKVIAIYARHVGSYRSRGEGYGEGAAPGVAVPYGTAECYHNSNNAANTMRYATENISSNNRCALSFKLF